MNVRQKILAWLIPLLTAFATAIYQANERFKGEGWVRLAKGMLIVAAIFSVVLIIDFFRHLAHPRDGARLSLEAQRFRGREWDDADYVFTVQNIGQRAAEDISFKPIRYNDWILQLNYKGTLVPADLKSPVGFTVSHILGQMEHKAYALRRFFEASTDGKAGKVNFAIEAEFIDLHRKRTQRFILECSMPDMVMRIRPKLAWWRGA